jgi:hypothetical protein
MGSNVLLTYITSGCIKLYRLFDKYEVCVILWQCSSLRINRRKSSDVAGSGRFSSESTCSFVCGPSFPSYAVRAVDGDWPGIATLIPRKCVLAS